MKICKDNPIVSRAGRGKDTNNYYRNVIVNVCFSTGSGFTESMSDEDFVTNSMTSTSGYL